MSTQLAFLDNNAPSTMPAFLANTEDRNLGNENMSAEDQAMPVLKLLQALSPEIEEIEGAKTGLFCNSVTGELFTDVYVVNLAYKREYAVFKQRQKGGGFQGTFDTRGEASEEITKLPGTPEDYDIIETGKHACLLLNPETGEPESPVMMFFKSTALPVSRNWNSNIANKGGQAARFATVWHITSTKQSNDRGSWANWKVDHAGFVSEELYATAKEMHAGIAAQM